MTNKQKMIFDYMVDKASENLSPIFGEAVKRGMVKIVPHFSDLYNNTYGQAISSYETFENIFKKEFETAEGLKIGELFGGIGFELEALDLNVSEENEYISLDIDHDYHSADTDNIEYKVCDVINGSAEEMGTEYDVLLCGLENSSHSCIETVEGIKNHLNLMYESLKEGGLLIFNTQNVHRENEGIDIAFSVDEIMFGEEHEGRFAHWLSVTEYLKEKDSFVYSDILIISDSDTLEDVSDIENCYVTVEGHTAKNWHPSIFMELAINAGFVDARELSNENILIFRK